LPGVEEIELPVITDVDDLGRADAHLLAYSEVKIRGLYLPVMRNGRENPSKVRFYIS
jgi:hypothetical protein